MWNPWEKIILLIFWGILIWSQRNVESFGLQTSCLTSSGGVLNYESGGSENSAVMCQLGYEKESDLGAVTA